VEIRGRGRPSVAHERAIGAFKLARDLISLSLTRLAQLYRNRPNVGMSSHLDASSSAIRLLICFSAAVLTGSCLLSLTDKPALFARAASSIKPAMAAYAFSERIPGCGKLFCLVRVLQAGPLSRCKAAAESAGSRDRLFIAHPRCPSLEMRGSSHRQPSRNRRRAVDDDANPDASIAVH
jgi:hypothetical protein